MLQNIVIDPASSPRGVGIAYDEKMLYVISNCCYSKLSGTKRKEKYGDGPPYFCRDCRGAVTDPGYAENCWLVEVDLISGNGRLFFTGKDITPWVAAWTGYPEEEINCNITMEVEF